MNYFKKSQLKNFKDFKFSEDKYLLSKEIMEEYEHIKKSFFQSINILKNYNSGRPSKSIKYIRELMVFYKRSNALLTNLINEMLNKSFIKTIEGRVCLFRMLNKIFRMFFLFDIHRFNHIDLFNDIAFYKIFRNKECNENLEMQEILRISTFCSLSMPMCRLFVSYFTADRYEIFHPVSLIRRPTLFLSETKKEFLYFICSIITMDTDFKYLKIFLCGLYEKIYDDTTFDSFYYELNKKERNYYCDLIDLK